MSGNYFNQEISPSQFNIQNQRFDETDISQADILPEKPIVHVEGDELEEFDDYDDEFGSRANHKNKKRERRYD